MPNSQFLTINQLFAKLPEDELKAVQVYFDDYVIDRYDHKYMNVQVLLLSLVKKDNTQQLMTFKEIRQLSPSLIWLKCPRRAFDKQVFNGLSKKLFKVYIKADRIKYKSFFYHECKAQVGKDQSKLNKYVDDRSEAKFDQMKERPPTRPTIPDDEIDDDYL